MILILETGIDRDGPDYRRLLDYLNGLETIEYRVHHVQGAEQLLTEIYLLGNTAPLLIDEMLRLPGVARAVRVSEPYRVLGRHTGDDRPAGFEYNGVHFGQDTTWIGSASRFVLRFPGAIPAFSTHSLAEGQSRSKPCDSGARRLRSTSIPLRGF